jgi:hypothetical protein
VASVTVATIAVMRNFNILLPASEQIAPLGVISWFKKDNVNARTRKRFLICLRSFAEQTSVQVSRQVFKIARTAFIGRTYPVTKGNSG